VKHYEHIIWDWNGTLLDDARLCVDVINGMLRGRGMSETDIDLYQETFDFPVEAYYQSLGFDFVAESFAALANEYCQTYDVRFMECALHRDATRVLATASRWGVSQSVLSAHEQHSLIRALDHFDILHYFETVVGQDNRHAVGKLEAGRELLQQLRVDPAKVLLIGDTRHDYEVASELGVACILVCHGHHSKQRLKSVHHQVVESLSAIGSDIEG
jgi:phosphoglycolate phosphatase